MHTLFIWTQISAPYFLYILSFIIPGYLFRYPTQIQGEETWNYFAGLLGLLVMLFMVNQKEKDKSAKKDMNIFVLIILAGIGFIRLTQLTVHPSSLCWNGLSNIKEQAIFIINRQDQKSDTIEWQIREHSKKILEEVENAGMCKPASFF